jgi:hypothetical protein
VVDAKDAFAVLRFKNGEPTELVGWTKNDAIKPGDHAQSGGG